MRRPRFRAWPERGLAVGHRRIAAAVAGGRVLVLLGADQRRGRGYDHRGCARALVPSTPALRGVVASSQAIVGPSTAAAGFDLTNAVRLTLGF